MANRSLRSAVGFVLAFLFALEASTRVDQAIRFGAPLFGRYSYDSVLFAHDQYGIRGRPHAHYEKWQLNGLGLRGPEAKPVPEPGKIRVVALGTSETFGLFESEGHEWPRVLDRALAARSERYEVLNGAIAGMSAGAQLRHFRRRLLPLRPDVVVWVVHYAAFADLDPARIDARAAETPAPPAAPGWTEMLELRAVQKAREALLPRLPKAVSEGIESARIQSKLARLRAEMGDRFGSIGELSAREIAAFDHFLATLVAESRTVGARVVVVLPPLRLDEKSLRIQTANFPFVAEHWLVESFETFAARADAAARAGDCGVADLRGLFDDAIETMMPDMVHFTDAGAERIGLAIVPCILSEDCRGVGTAARQAMPPDGPVAQESR